MNTDPNSAPNNAGHPPDAEVEQLLREGVAAVKLGDKATARNRLNEVVSRDQYNELGWLWLAQVVETDDERRVCLGNVIVINPNNVQAQRMLNQLDHPGSMYLDDFQTPGAAEAPPAMLGPIKLPPALARLDRRLLIGGGAAILTLVCLVCLLIVLPALNSGAPPAVVELPSDTPTGQKVTTAILAVTATITPTIEGLVSGQATLPPSWTPSATHAVGGGEVPVAPTPPAGLPGHLIVISGTVFGTGTFLPMFQVSPDGQQKIPLGGNDRGDYAALGPDGVTLVYSYFQSSQNVIFGRVSGIRGGTRELSSLWDNKPPLADQKMLSISRTGTGIAFSALGLAENDTTADIFYLPYQLGTVPGPANTPTAGANAAPAENVTPTPDLSGVPALKIIRITAKDSGVNTWPALSPDGKNIVFAGDTTTAGTPGTDLYLVSTFGGPPQNLTNDAATNTEAAPDWSPDGTKLVFQAIAAGSKNNALFVMDASGQNKTPLVDDKSDNIRPHWSPDGKYIAFSSNRTGRYEVFIIEVATQTLYQVTTQSKNMSLCTSWGP